MKKVCFALVAIAVYLISCTGSKESANLKFGKDYYNDPFVKKYVNNPNFINPDSAFIYINAFKKHKYKVFGKGKLENAWSYFDIHTLDTIISDPQTDSIYFFLAAYTKSKNIEKDKRRHPFVIMQVMPKELETNSGKGSNDANVSLGYSVYFIPKPICPPPNTGCRIPGAE